jgi:uncharacterized NAD(P)/FAD-binding protein YdhS
VTRTIAIIGGGLSGTLTAVHLLHRAVRDDLHVILINRSGWLARGVAYGTRSESHVLNVPGGRMSAFPDDEDHFLRFARSRDPSIASGTFAPRRIYGEYLEGILHAAQARLPDAKRFVHLVGQVRDIELKPRSGAGIVLTDGSTIVVERVILALGNFAPADPYLSDPTFFRTSPRYIRDPWQTGALDRVDPVRPVLLIGTGLTAVDIALYLRAHGCAGRMSAISRRGLLPQPHRSPGAPPLLVDLPSGLLSGPATVRRWTGLLRRRIAQLAAQGVDWRETLASLRSATPGLWQRLSPIERARFLRHLQPYWDVHRHRLAPQLAKVLDELRVDGVLDVHAGRIESVEDNGRDVNVTFRPRGTDQIVQMSVGTVINCTGPNSNLGKLREPLIEALVGRGVLTPDALGLGIAVSNDSTVVQSDGSVSGVVHYIGPFLKAQFWESTAVPELRLHAIHLVTRLCAGLVTGTCSA